MQRSHPVLDLRSHGHTSPRRQFVEVGILFINSLVKGQDAATWLLIPAESEVGHRRRLPVGGDISLSIRAGGTDAYSDLGIHSTNGCAAAQTLNYYED